MDTDILRINGKFMRKIITDLVKHYSKKKLGMEISLDLSNIEIKQNPTNPDEIRFDISANGIIPKEGLNHLIKKVTSNE